MPKKNNAPPDRISVQYPTKMIEAVDALIKKLPHLFRNRQNFLEHAVVECITRYEYLSRGISPPEQGIEVAGFGSH